MKRPTKKPPAAKKPRRRPVPDPKAKNLRGRRGRRGHPVIEENPELREWLVDALKRRPAPTLDELVEESKGTGFAVGRDSIYNFKVAFEAELARKELNFELARIYNEASKDGNVLDLETAIGTLFASRIFAELQANASLDDKTLALLDSFRKLQSSSAQRERTRFHVERGVRATKMKIRAQMQDLLKRDPDTLRKVLAVIDRAAAEVTP
ncbi:MAG: hypothetical protein ACXW5J_26750 [Thermoanaerobaculia bacterium]